MVTIIVGFKYILVQDLIELVCRFGRGTQGGNVFNGPTSRAARLFLHGALQKAKGASAGVACRSQDRHSLAESRRTVLLPLLLLLLPRWGTGRPTLLLLLLLLLQLLLL